MEIRKLEKKDLPSLLELYVQLDTKNIGLTAEGSENVWNEIESNEHITYIGAVDSINGAEKVVATCYCVIIPNITNGNQPVCYIENVVTDENYRKQGLAKLVIQKALDIAKAHNCYKAFLLSGMQRTEAHRFYEKIGFSGNAKKGFYMQLD